jgi:hypothetical protein
LSAAAARSVRAVISPLGLVLTVACAALASACGSGGGSARTGTRAGSAADVEFADCMRAHGVSDFPDPLPGGGFPTGAIPPTPVARTATKACASILRAGSAPPPPTADDRAALLRFAVCMRAHGVPSFPDPVTLSEVPRNRNVFGVGSMVFPLGVTIDPQSPAFRRAGGACGAQLPGGRPKGG